MGPHVKDSFNADDPIRRAARDMGSLPPQRALGFWRLASPYGIFDSKQNSWFTGSVWAVHPLSGDRLLVGAEQGGLWLSEPYGKGGFDSRCLSDQWDHWGVTALLADPADPDRIFVGCNDTIGADGVGNDGTKGGVYVGSVSIEKWSYLKFPSSISGGVYSMIILPKQRVLVVATGVGTSATGLGGLLWTSIDPPFAWYSDPTTASDLANLPDDSFLIADQSKNLLRRARIRGLSTTGGPTVAQAPFSTFDTAIKWKNTPASWTPIRVASCANDPHFAYCVGFIENPGQDKALFAIRSTDGGQNWEECGHHVPNRMVPATFAQNLGALEGGPKTRYSVAVHPKTPNIVALGCKAVLLSNDSGSSWFAVDSGGVSTRMVPWHDDIHELRFDEENVTLLVPSDGGILAVPSLVELISPPKVSFPLVSSPDVVDFSTDDRRNRTLPIVMLLDPTTSKRAFMGNLAVDNSGNIAAGTLDNGNLWLNPNGFWQPIDDGDGGFVAISAQPTGTYAIHARSGGNDLPANWAQLDGNAWADLGIIPLILNENVSDANGLRAGKETFPNGTMRAVPPGVLFGAGWPILALASYGDNQVYGAMIASSPFFQGATWILLGSVPFGENIAALEVHDPNSILVGTNSGRLFRLYINGRAVEILFNDDIAGAVRGIASNGETILCFKGASQQYVYAGQLEDSPHIYFRLRAGLNRVPATSFPANDGSRVFRAISANRSSIVSGLSFGIVANEHEVWVSHSREAATWDLATSGLPKAVRCADISFSESGDLFLSTYGRALWLHS
jgi:hypothetical protein